MQLIYIPYLLDSMWSCKEIKYTLTAFIGTKESSGERLHKTTIHLTNKLLPRSDHVILWKKRPTNSDSTGLNSMLKFKALELGGKNKTSKACLEGLRQEKIKENQKNK